MENYPLAQPEATFDAGREGVGMQAQVEAQRVAAVEALRQYETALRNSEDLFRVIAEFTYDCESWIAPDGKLLWVTPAVTGLTGYSVEECRAMHGYPIPIVGSEDRERMSRLWTQALAGSSSNDVEFRVERKDHGMAWGAASWQPITDSQGTRLGYRLSIRDITKRKQQEMALHESDARFRAAFEHAGIGMALLTLDGMYMRVNDAFCRMLGYTAEALLALSVQAVTHPEDSHLFTEAVQRLLKTETPSMYYEKRYIHKAGHQARARITLAAVRDQTGTPLYLIAQAEDVTDMRRTEAELQQYAQRLQSLSRRLVETQERERRSLALELHDQVGQALTGLKIVLEFCARHPRTNIQAQLVQASSLIQDLITRIHDMSLELRPSMLDDLGLLSTLSWYLEKYTSQTQVSVSFSHAGLDHRLPLDIETACYRIIQEALTNVARHAQASHARVRIQVERSAVTVEIEDHGRGFALADVSIPGKACGLSGIEERARVLHGTVTIESQPGAGTRISALLPLT